MKNKIEELEKDTLNLLKQATEEKSHFYVGSILTRWLEYKKEQDEKVEKLKDWIENDKLLFRNLGDGNMESCNSDIIDKIDKIFKNQGEEK